MNHNGSRYQKPVSRKDPYFVFIYFFFPSFREFSVLRYRTPRRGGASAEADDLDLLFRAKPPARLVLHNGSLTLQVKNKNTTQRISILNFAFLLSLRGLKFIYIDYLQNLHCRSSVAAAQPAARAVEKWKQRKRATRKFLNKNFSISPTASRESCAQCTYNDDDKKKKGKEKKVFTLGVCKSSFSYVIHHEGLLARWHLSNMNHSRTLCFDYLFLVHGAQLHSNILRSDTWFFKTYFSF